MLTKTQQVDRITVTTPNILEVRTATAVLENDIELSRSYHRHTLSPGDDLTGQDPRVVAVAEAIWTPEVIQEYLQRVTN